ncbi:ABC transporter permease [Streptomyces sp. CA-106131]|uniref:ABC transporter permease n=1 Tax=Streptomyces sp. CA-106131 TaxID=3240045 RepID=UPI003D8F86AE
MNLALDNGLPSPGRVLVWFDDPLNWWGPGGLIADVRQHIVYTLIVITVAAMIALPVGLVIGHTSRGTLLVAGVANVLRAVPALGLLILLVVVLSPHIHVQGGVPGILAPGSVPYFIPAALVLILIAVPQILTSTYAGIQALDPAVRDAARGCGMTPLQVVLKVELPAAAPLIISGIRSATLQVIATLAVAAYAPLVGGLGRLIVDGQQDLADPRYGYPAMLAAGITVAVLAVATDALLALAQRKATSPGLALAPTDTRPHTRSRSHRGPGRIPATSKELT